METQSLTASQQATAKQYSKNAIFIWLVVGLIYIAVAEQEFAWWVVALLFLPGIFLASFAAIPVMHLDNRAKAFIIRTHTYPKIRAIFRLATGMAVRVGLFAVQAALPIIAIKLCTSQL